MARHAELVEVGAHRPGREAELAQRGDRRPGRALGELLAVFPEDQPVVDVLGRRRPERLVESTVDVLVGPVVVPAVDPSDAEVGVVHHAGEVVRRAAVLA